MTVADPDAIADDASGATEADSLLAQMALVLGQTGDGAATAVQATAPEEMQLAADAAGGEESTLKSSWQLLSSLAGGGDGEAQTGVTDNTAAPNALAALSDGVEETTFANLMAPGSQRGDDTASDASYPAMTVTVAGEETHFAPVQSAESALSQLAQRCGCERQWRAGRRARIVQPLPKARMHRRRPPAVPGLPRQRRRSPRPVSARRWTRAAARTAREARDVSPKVRRRGRRPISRADAPAPSRRPSSRPRRRPASAGPSSDASPSEQIARRIAAELANPASRPATSASSSDGAVKVLHLQLEPANLGSVTVRIALKDNVISLQVEASRHETAFAIEKDRELLSNALKSAGYVVDGISSQPAGDPARPSLQAQPVSNDGQMSSSLQSQSDSQSGLAQSGRRNQGEEGRQFTESGFAPVCRS